VGTEPFVTGWHELKKSTTLFFLAAQGPISRQLTEPESYRRNPPSQIKEFIAQLPLGVGVDFWHFSISHFTCLLHASLGREHREVFSTIADMFKPDFKGLFLKGNADMFQHLLSHSSCASISFSKHAKCAGDFASLAAFCGLPPPTNSQGLWPDLPVNFDAMIGKYKYLIAPCLPLVHRAAMEHEHLEVLFEDFLTNENQKISLASARGTPILKLISA